MRGKFIVLEGPDSAGKSTQLELLSRELSRRGIRAIATKEPGGTELGKALRKLVLSPGREVVPLAELFIMLADRAQHVEELIRPALSSGTWVISSRYTLSSLAYQGYGRGLPLDLIRELNRIATGGLVPDHTFLLDIPPEVALERGRLGDRLEREGLDFLRRVREAYLRLIEEVPNSHVIDATKPPEEVCREMLEHLGLA